MKELLKQFLPPLILDGLRKLRGDATGCIELSGWPDSDDDYNNSDIAQLVAAKTAYRISHTPEELTLSELQSIAAVAAAAGYTFSRQSMRFLNWRWTGALLNFPGWRNCRRRIRC